MEENNLNKINENKIKPEQTAELPKWILILKKALEEDKHHGSK